MVGMIKDAAKMQIDQTGKSGTISMTVECVPSHWFPARLGRAAFKGIIQTLTVDSFY